MVVMEFANVFNYAINTEKLARAHREEPSSWKWNMKDVLTQIERLGKSFDPSFVIDNDNKFLYRNIVLWLMGDKGFQCIDPKTGAIRNGRIDKGLYIAGNVGTGKSTAMRIVSRLYRLNPFKLSSGKCYPWVTVSANMVPGTYERYGDAALVDLMRRPLLCIEDLGSEDKEAVYMGNRRNVFRKILEYRGDELTSATMVTSNIPLGHPNFAEMYGQRAQSRCFEMMNYLVLKGDDRRRCK